ncbi:MAG: amino acid permease [Polyangiaceae bacterium]
MKELERSIGPIAVIAISMSAMLGSGIFVLPGLAAAKTGPSVWAAYLLAGVCVFPAAACKAELSTAMPTSGGTYVYLDRIFGPLAGTVSGVALWLAMLLKSSFALVGIGTYLVVLGNLPVVPTALVCLVGIVALNLLGIKKVGRAQIGVLAATLVALGVLVPFGLAQASRENLSHEMTHGVPGLIAAAGFVFASFAGVNKVAAFAEEVRNPARNLPLGILASLFIVMALYSLVSFTLVGAIPHQRLHDDLHPIYTLAHGVGGYWAGIAAGVIGVVTMASMANSGLLAASRLPFALARDRLLPGLLKEVGRESGTPVASIVLTGAAMALAVSILNVEGLAKTASGLVIMLFIAENVAVIVFRESRVHWYQPKYRSPFYPWLQGFGVVSGVVLLVTLGAAVVLGALLAVLPGLALYVFYGRRRVERLGVLGQRVRRAVAITAPPVTSRGPDVVEEASVVVALFGKEHSPEMVVELGAALAKDRRIQVIHLTEAPEHTTIEAALEEDVSVRSLRRRVQALGEERDLSLEFHAIVSRDLGHTVHSVSSSAHCEWLVMEWRGRERQALVPYNPIGWLMNNLGSNLAFYKDGGVRFVREILVYAEPGPHDALVVRTADHLASLWKAKLTLIRFAANSASDIEVRLEQEYLEQLGELCSAPVTKHVARGVKRIKTLAAETAAYDLLVMGAPDVTLARQILGTDQDHIKARAACSVLTVKTPRQFTHRAYSEASATRAPAVPTRLPDFLAPGAIAARLDITRKEALFQQIAQVFEPVIEGVSARQIVDALWERERTQNTSVGHGVALPHATLNTAKALVGVFTTRKPIDYQGPDGAPVDVFFVTICSPSQRQTHLELLSRVAGLTLKTKLLERLRAAEDAETIRVALQECSAELEASGRSPMVSLPSSASGGT